MRREVQTPGYEVLVDRFLPLQPPGHYEWPLLGDQTDLVLALDRERLSTLLFASVAV